METNRGRALNHWQKQTVQTLLEGSRAETIRGNTIVANLDIPFNTSVFIHQDLHALILV